jgi:transposase
MNETLIRTISIKLDIDGHEAALQETQKYFNEAASWIASLCWEEGITNTNTAHHRVYGETRSRFGLGAQLAVCARAKAIEAIKVVKTQQKETCPQFGPRGSVRYDARTYRLLSLDRVSLNTIQGRVVCKLILGKRQHTMLIDQTWKIGGADLVWRRGTYYLNVTQSKDALVLEDLTGIRERVTVRHENRYERHSWASIPVRFVDPRNTSRTCSECGHCEKANRQSQSSFKCQQCGFCLNADYNAALNISRVPVKVPLVASVRG